jgi:hypothetical protein
LRLRTIRALKPLAVKPGTSCGEDTEAAQPGVSYHPYDQAALRDMLSLRRALVGARKLLTLEVEHDIRHHAPRGLAPRLSVKCFAVCDSFVSFPHIHERVAL